ncbi:ABC transporter permease [Pseudalkalibacillus caeni]|uniref:ABC transporter permease subunit n=1 Tax=Exobacillus caeni TaxID=2574798 RepID=A0A5R9FBB8_9BACL|nr:ABC transporter permease subunit [Pseudalkalibacillus caeni]TLS38183.1 ABC transporter permease subunit [Pseudalkalibacillus caeni]
MIKRLLRQPLFLLGFILVSFLLIGSILYHYIGGDVLPKTELKYDSDGMLVGKPPFTPLETKPLGTDNYGYHLWEQILIGAKYTIGAALIIAVLRVLLSFVFGVVSGTYFKKGMEKLSGLIDSIQYVPISLLAYFLLLTVLNENGAIGAFEYSFAERVVFQIVLLTVIAIPSTTLLISNETNSVWKKEFIESARTIGGNRFHILIKHILPHLYPRLTIVFIQQVVSALLLLLHLGLLKLFFGGTNIQFGITGNAEDFLSTTYEWSGLIGSTWRYLTITPWVPLSPIAFFAVTILGFNLMLQAIKQTLDREDSPGTSRKNHFRDASLSVPVPKDEKFEFIYETELHEASNQ